jgi:hypothetical protein
MRLVGALGRTRHHQRSILGACLCMFARVQPGALVVRAAVQQHCPATRLCHANWWQAVWLVAVIPCSCLGGQELLVDSGGSGIQLRSHQSSSANRQVHVRACVLLLVSLHVCVGREGLICMYRDGRTQHCIFPCMPVTASITYHPSEGSNSSGAVSTGPALAMVWVIAHMPPCAVG